MDSQIEAQPTDHTPRSTLHVWWLATRPKTLWAALIPVGLGAAMAWDDGVFHAPALLAALVGALFIQIGTNFVNDLSDFVKGADTETRKGPMRVTQAGLVTLPQIRVGIIVAFSISVLAGVYLIWRGGWPVVWIGVASIVSGTLYTAGPKPLGYLGLGDLFVLVFFGPVAVGGTYYVQALTVTPEVLIAGLGPGLLSVALLVVNNLRDVDEDRLVGKRTLAVRFGRTFVRWEYALSVALAALLPAGLYLTSGERPWTLLVVATLALGWPLIRRVFQTDGAALNPLLGQTGRLGLIYALVLGVTWVL